MNDPPGDAASPKPARLKARYEIDGGRMRVELRRTQWGTGLFMAVWLTGWTVGCVALAHTVIAQRQIGMLLFALPFWSSWIFVAVMLIWMLFGRETLEVDSRAVRIWRQAWIKFGRREIPLEEVRGFIAGERVTSAENRATEPCLTIQSVGAPVDVLAGLPETELRWLVAQLQQLLPQPGPMKADPVGPAAETDEATAIDETSIYDKAPLTQEQAEPPSDSRWRLSDEIESLTFVQRGDWSWSAVLSLLFINCFWNGIVSVFVLLLFGAMPGQAPKGWERVGLAVFLIPFEVIGLVMFVGLVLALLDPLRRLTWRFEGREIVCRLAWLGFGKTWRYPVEHVGRLEVLSNVKSRSAKFSMTIRSASSSAHEAAWQHALRIIDGSNRVVCQIDKLTQGEAHWMADQVKRKFATQWFC